MNSKKRTERKRSSLSILSAMGIEHRDECGLCLLNCKVKHDENTPRGGSVEPGAFWALDDGRKPQYTFETCPKASMDDEMKKEVAGT